MVLKITTILINKDPSFDEEEEFNIDEKDWDHNMTSMHYAIYFGHHEVRKMVVFNLTIVRLLMFWHLLELKSGLQDHFHLNSLCTP